MVKWWHSRWGRWLSLLVWMGAIYLLSNQPKDDIPSFGVWDLLVKKGAHFLAYALLAVLAWRLFEGGKRPFRQAQYKPYLYAILFIILYAISDEYHQTFISGRHGQPVDVVIDSLGGAAALFSLRKNWFRSFDFLNQSTPSQ